MPQHYCLVDLSLAKPRSFLSREKDLDGNVLITPLALPHLTVPTLANTSNEGYLLRYCSLNLTATSHHDKCTDSVFNSCQKLHFAIQV